jgi:lipopolysaccharide biosynthesis glycosyltransferase
MGGNVIFIGFDTDPKEIAAFAVARRTIRKQLTQPIPIRGLVLDQLRAQGLYWREHEWRHDPAHMMGGQWWDKISEAPMSTEFAISRFLVPHLAKDADVAVFLDADMMARGNMARLLALADHRYAVQVVKHKYEPTDEIKMSGQIQTRYARKNWSSLMMFNVNHPSNKKLTVEMINTLPGRDLHRFCWLEDDEIGELPPEWNWLEGHSSEDIDAKLVHYTAGGPWLQGRENIRYADEWRAAFHDWASTG